MAFALFYRIMWVVFALLGFIGGILSGWLFNDYLSVSITMIVIFIGLALTLFFAGRGLTLEQEKEE